MSRNNKPGQSAEDLKDENGGQPLETPQDGTPAAENPAPAGDENGGQPDETSQDADKGGDSEEPKKEKTMKMILKHKSHTPRYHRCGLTITQVFAEYDVPEDCVKKIKSDKWIVVKEGK